MRNETLNKADAEGRNRSGQGNALKDDARHADLTREGNADAVNLNHGARPASTPDNKDTGSVGPLAGPGADDALRNQPLSADPTKKGATGGQPSLNSAQAEQIASAKPSGPARNVPGPNTSVGGTRGR